LARNEKKSAGNSRLFISRLINEGIQMQEVVRKIQVQTVPEALQEALWHRSFLLLVSGSFIGVWLGGVTVR